MITTFNAYHLGDNLIHLNFLRLCVLDNPGREFGHYCAEQHRAQLLPVIADLPQIRLLEQCPPDAIDAWRGAGGFWHMHEHRNDFVWFHKDWFWYLSKQMGLAASPIQRAEDMLFDYPAMAPSGAPTAEFDYLVINSFPHSGQLSGFNPHDFVRLVEVLQARGKVCITTYPTGRCECTNDGSKGLDVTGIGRLSQSARCIVGVATGPIWTTFNTWNPDTPRVILLDNERLDLVEGVRHVRSVAEAMEYL